jgi:PIF1-like helicase
VNPNDNVDDFNLELESGTLLPTLTSSDATACMSDRRLLVGHNPTGASLTKLVCEDIPLNFKQRLVVEKVLSKALAWKDHLYGESKRQQFRLLFLGEAGVGKSWIIKGIKAGMDLVDRKKEVIVMAPTGLASNEIGGSTYHTAPSVPIICCKERTTVSCKTTLVWKNDHVRRRAGHN